MSVRIDPDDRVLYPGGTVQGNVVCVFDTRREIRGKITR